MKTYDSFYFSKLSDTRLSTKSTTTFDNFNLYGDKFIQLEETLDNSIIIENSNNKKK